MAERLPPVLTAVLNAAALLPLAAWSASANDLGKKSFEACAACHSLRSDENGTGPTLHNLLGCTAGTAPGFRYSGPMKRSGIVWDEKTLAKFLRNPQEAISGNRMPYSGMTDEAALKALIGYLKDVTK